MFLAEILFALVLAALLTAVVYFGFNRTGPWGSIGLLFVMLFLATWAFGIWLAPLGPVALGVSWVPMVVVALVLAVLFAAMTPTTRSVSTTQTAAGIAAEGAVGMAFWLLLTVLVAAIALFYVGEFFV